MYQKINITLHQQTINMIEQIANKHNRSSFIDEAVRYYIEHIKKVKLREQLKEGAINRAERDLKISKELNDLEDYSSW